MPWKMDGDHVALEGGNPVWTYEDGKTAPVEFDKALSKISDLNKGEKRLREDLESAGTRLKGYEVFHGDDGKPLDPSEVRRALETVKGLSDRKLIEAGEVQRIKDDAVKAYVAEVDTHKKTIEGLNAKLVDKEKGWAFAQSKFLKDKMLLPPDMAFKIFGDSFRVEGEKVIGYIGEDKIPSRKTIGELADFDEALETMVERHPYKDTLLRSDGTGGSGALPNPNAPKGGGKSMRRSEYESKPPDEQRTFIMSGGTLTDA